MKIKTIDVNAKEWFDKVNGNSYFSVVVTLNYGLKDVKHICVPFQYGYGDHYIDMSWQETIKQLNLGFDYREIRLRQYCADNNIILRCDKQENCLKRDVVAWGVNDE